MVHSCGDCEVDVTIGTRRIVHRFYMMDTQVFDFVQGTDFFAEHPQILSLTLQAPYVLHVDHGDGQEPVPLEQSEQTSSYLRVCKKEPSAMMVASKTEDYQLLGGVLDEGLKELGYSREDLSLELFASDKQRAQSPHIGHQQPQTNNRPYLGLRGSKHNSEGTSPTLYGFRPFKLLKQTSSGSWVEVSGSFSNRVRQYSFPACWGVSGTYRGV